VSHIQPPSEQFETTVSHGLFSGKDMLMETDIHAIEQEEMVAHAETVVTDLERLAGCGFTSEESVALLWLQRWYQTGGSDRVGLVRNFEFLKHLIMDGKLEL